MKRSGFFALLVEALNDFYRSGYNASKLELWMMRLRAELDRELPGDVDFRESLRKSLSGILSRQGSNLQRSVPDMLRYTIDLVRPALRAELDRRIFAGVSLIKLNRARRIDETLQRFAGWVSSTPDKREAVRTTASEIAKPVRQVRFEQRRVAIDQGHKLNAAVAATVAHASGAIAAVWRDRGALDPHYDARPEHLARSGKMFILRDSWAIEQGLVRRGALPYTDSIEMPAELPYCSCYYEYLSRLDRVPETILTRAGRAHLGQVLPARTA